MTTEEGMQKILDVAWKGASAEKESFDLILMGCRLSKFDNGVLTIICPNTFMLTTVRQYQHQFLPTLQNHLVNLLSVVGILEE